MATCPRLATSCAPSLLRNDAQNRIFVELYSVVDPDLACTQVLLPFNANLPLGSFPGGHYSVWINGQEMDQFDT